MKNSARARLVWQVLATSAERRQTLTYGLLATLIDTHPRALIGPLDHIMKYCQSQGLPPLTVLVVNQETGVPGSGLSTVENLPKDRERVFNHAWLSLLPPTEEDFEAV